MTMIRIEISVPQLDDFTIHWSEYGRGTMVMTVALMKIKIDGACDKPNISS